MVDSCELISPTHTINGVIAIGKSYDYPNYIKVILKDVG